MEINSANVSQIQPLQQQPQQQQAVDQRAFEQDLAAQEQSQQSVETVHSSDEVLSSTTDYSNLTREAQTQLTQSVQAPSAISESGQTQDVQHIAITAYQENQESYQAPTSSGELLPRIDAIV